MELPRITGTEMEYAISSTSLDIFGKELPQAFVPRSMLEPWRRGYIASPESGLLTGGGCNTSNSYLSNGSRLYVDSGDHLEYATPESASIAETVANEIVGERIVHLIANYGLRNTDSVHSVTVNKRVATEDTTELNSSYDTWGYHENYAVRRMSVTDGHDTVSSSLLSVLSAHLVTRSIFFGAGIQLANGQFCIAQKALNVQRDYSYNTIGNSKSVVNTRDQPLANRNWWRMHVTVGDANISTWATFMKLATTSLLLRLIEHGIELPDIALANLAQDANRVAADPTLRTSVRTEKDRDVLAIDIQHQLAEACMSFVGNVDVPFEEKLAASEWLTACEETKKDVDWLGKRADWYLKWQRIERYRAKHELSLTDPSLQGIDRQWDQIDPGKDVATYLRNRLWSSQWSLPEDEIIKRIDHIPDEGRPRLRGQFLAHCLLHRVSDYEINWHYIKLGGRTIILNNPYQSQHNGLDELLASTARRS